MNRLHNVFVCPICGTPMVHHRLRGYQCWNEEHNSLRQQLINRAILRSDFDDTFTWCVRSLQESIFHAIDDLEQRTTLCGAVLLEYHPEIDYRKPTCPNCLKRLSEQNSKMGE